MSEELLLKDQQMKKLTEQIQMLLDGLAKSKRKDMDLAEIGSRIREFQMTLDGAQLELKQLGPHASHKAELTKQIRDHKNTLKQFKADYEWVKKGTDKDELLDGAKSSAAGADLATGDDMMKHGLDVQDKSKASLQRTLRVANEAKDIGIDVVAKLEADTQKLENITDNINSIDTTLARSRKVIARIARRMMTDKVIWCLAFLVLVAIIAVIAWSQVKKKKDDSAAAGTANAGYSLQADGPFVFITAALCLGLSRLLS